MEVRYRWTAVTFTAALLLTLAACGKNEASTPVTAKAESSTTTPRRGGEATVLVSADFAGTWPAGLDPATNHTGGANIVMTSAVFGGLFQLRTDPDGSNARVAPYLAAGYEARDEGRTFVLKLRPGMKFSDGTSFNADAVKFNIDRALKSACTCAPRTWPWVEDEAARVAVVDDNTVELHFSRPYGPVLSSFTVTNINWIVSPAALKTMGEDEFKIRPVGAGPFRIVSNQLSSRLVLERNPYFWQEDRPYLDKLTFQSIGNEQAGFQAVTAGDAHAFVALTSSALIEHAEKTSGLTLTMQPSVSTYVVQLNTAVAPFDNQRAREAIYYATNSEAISKGLFKGRFPASQSFTTPAGLFHHDRIEGYRAYHPEKARALVKELGGLRFTLGTLRSSVSEQVITALQSQWREVGIDVKIESYDLGGVINAFRSKQWNSMLQTAGSYDPESGSGLRARFDSKAPFSGVHDPKLDALIASASSTLDPKQRDDLYLQASRYISDNAYAPFVVATGNAQLTRGVYGPGLTTKIPPILINTLVNWQDVWVAAE